MIQSIPPPAVHEKKRTAFLSFPPLSQPNAPPSASFSSPYSPPLAGPTPHAASNLKDELPSESPFNTPPSMKKVPPLGLRHVQVVPPLKRREDHLGYSNKHALPGGVLARVSVRQKRPLTPMQCLSCIFLIFALLAALLAFLIVFVVGLRRAGDDVILPSGSTFNDRLSSHPWIWRESAVPFVTTTDFSGPRHSYLASSGLPYLPDTSSNPVPFYNTFAPLTFNVTFTLSPDSPKDLLRRWRTLHKQVPLLFPRPPILMIEDTSSDRTLEVPMTVHDFKVWQKSPPPRSRQQFNATGVRNKTLTVTMECSVDQWPSYSLDKSKSVIDLRQSPDWRLWRQEGSAHLFLRMSPTYFLPGGEEGGSHEPLQLYIGSTYLRSKLSRQKRRRQKTQRDPLNVLPSIY